MFLAIRNVIFAPALTCVVMLAFYADPGAEPDPDSEDDMRAEASFRCKLPAVDPCVVAVTVDRV